MCDCCDDDCECCLCCPDRCARAPFFNFMWFVCDPCGVTCVVFVYGFIIYAFVAMEFFIFPGWLGSDNPYLLVNEALFALMTFLMIFAHYKAMTTDPGTLAYYSKEKPPVFPFGRGTSRASGVNGNADDDSSVKKRPAIASRTVDIGGDKFDVSEPEGLEYSDTLKQLVPRKVRVCKKCVNLKPSRVHHCSVCNRCVMKMDHHCPWVNNCVGQFNQRYFLQFLVYIGVGSLYALVSTIWSAVNCLGAQRKQRNVSIDETGLCSGASTVMAVLGVLLCFEAVIFGLFVLIMFCDQISAIWNDVTGVEQLKEDKESENEHKTSLWQNLREVMGGPFSWRWFAPIPMPSEENGRAKLKRLLDAEGSDSC